MTPGWRRFYALSGCRACLGDDTGGDGGGDFGSGDFGGFGLGPSDLVASGSDGSTPIDWTAVASPNYTPPPDSQFSTPDPGSFTQGGGIFGQADSSGGISLPDGSYIGANGQTLLPDGTDIFPDGSMVQPDGTYVDASGNSFPPDSPQAQVAGQAAAAGRAQAAGGSSSGGGKAGGSGSGSGLNTQQIICIMNPTLPQCRQGSAVPAVTRPAASSSSFTNFLSQNAGWLIALGVVVVVLPEVMGK